MKKFTKMLSELNEGNAISTRKNTVIYKAKQQQIVVQPPFGSEMMPTKLKVDIYGSLKDQERFFKYQKFIDEANMDCNVLFIELQKNIKKIMDDTAKKINKA